jgi:hypothetical protein
MMMISFFTIGSPFDSILSSFVSLIVHSWSFQFLCCREIISFLQPL